MSPDEPSLSDHEQRILAEIERNLKAEDPEFVRQVSEAKPPAKSSARLFQLSLFGLLIGIALLGGYFTNIGFGVVGFLVMVASLVGIVTAVRNLTAVGRSPTSAFRDVFRRAEERMRSRRPPEG